MQHNVRGRRAHSPGCCISHNTVNIIWQEPSPSEGKALAPGTLNLKPLRLGVNPARHSQYSDKGQPNSVEVQPKLGAIRANMLSYNNLQLLDTL